MIFNKTISAERIGNEELAALLGFSFESLEFDRLQPYILTDEARIRKIIGNAIYDAAQSRYNASGYSPDLTSSDKLDQLVHRIQAAHVFTAYLSFAKNNDLSHGSSGRKVMVGTDEKTPWEWQVENDNRALLRKAYDALDALLYFLEQNAGATGFTAWKDSAERKQLRGRFIQNMEQFDALFPIDKSMRFFMLMRPFMLEVEQDVVASSIGQTRYDAILQKLANAHALSAEEAKIVELASRSLAYFTLEDAMFKLADEEMPETILRTYFPYAADRNKSPELKKSQQVVFRNAGQKHLRVLQQYLATLDNAADPVSFEINSPDNKFFQV